MPPPPGAPYATAACRLRQPTAVPDVAAKKVVAVEAKSEPSIPAFAFELKPMVRTQSIVVRRMRMHGMLGREGLVLALHVDMCDS